jgi:hypothetical protein
MNARIQTEMQTHARRLLEMELDRARIKIRELKWELARARAQLADFFYLSSVKNLPVPVLAEPVKRIREYGGVMNGEARESTENCDRTGEGSSMADSRGGHLYYENEAQNTNTKDAGKREALRPVSNDKQGEQETESQAVASHSKESNATSPKNSCQAGKSQKAKQVRALSETDSGQGTSRPPHRLQHPAASGVALSTVSPAASPIGGGQNLSHPTSDL